MSINLPVPNLTFQSSTPVFSTNSDASGGPGADETTLTKKHQSTLQLHLKPLAPTVTHRPPPLSLVFVMDPESFMKNSPFHVANDPHYNLSNTTPELLKFHLHEQTRQPPALAPLLMDTDFNVHLQNAIASNNVSIDYDHENDENDEFLRDGDSGTSTPLSNVSEPLKAVAGADKTNYMNLKVLIENSVFDASKTSVNSVLSLHKAKQLKLAIASKKEHKEYLEQRISIANHFCSTLLAGADASADLDSGLLLKIFKQNIDLQQQLMLLSAELDLLSQKLTNHNLACLVLGYVKDVELSHSASGMELAAASKEAPVDAVSQQAFESLFSHIASVAVQKNVPLPDHALDVDNTLAGKIAWAQSCIDALVQSSPESAAAPSAPSTATSTLTRGTDVTSAADNSVLNDHSFLSATPYAALNGNALDKTISEYKIALNDLRFSHQFFMKEYEYLKENSLKTILEYRRKNAALEKEVATHRNGSSMSLNEFSRDTLNAKDKEIAQLRKDINLLKVEYLGSKSPRNSTIASPPLLFAPEMNASGGSPIQQISTASSASSAILRKEFKKLVTDIQDRYEVELGEERLKRRQLEDKLAKLDINA